MDAEQVPTHVHQHAQAVERGDMDAVTDDFATALRRQVPEIAEILPAAVR